MLPVKQSFPSSAAIDAAGAVHSGFSRLGDLDLENKSIAITGGSQGMVLP